MARSLTLLAAVFAASCLELFLPPPADGGPVVDEHEEHEEDDAGHDAGGAGDAGDDEEEPPDAGNAGGGDDDAGPPPAPDAGPPPSCDPGFVSTANGCAPDAPEPFLSRTTDDVCSRWTSDYRSVPSEWEAVSPGDACDPGAIPDDARANALGRANLYRWLAGVPPLALDDSPARVTAQQQCAVIMAAMGGLDHDPPSNAPCYTPEGAQGAGSSNLSGGAGLAGSVDLYMSDSGVGSLGHRRWVLSPSNAVTQFGHKQGWSCMFTFSSGGTANPPFVAWPPPGYVPAAAAAGPFSFVSASAAPTGATVVEIAIDDGEYQEVEWQDLQYGYGWGYAISFAPPTSLFAVWSAGKTVRVRVRNTAQGDFAWTTRFVSCG